MLRYCWLPVFVSIAGFVFLMSNYAFDLVSLIGDDGEETTMYTMTQRMSMRDNGSWLVESPPPQDVLDTIGRAKQLLSAEVMPEPGDIRDRCAARLALDSAWQAARRVLDRGDVRAGSPELIRLLSRIRRDRNVLHDLEVRQRSESMRVAWEALGRFRGISTVDALVDICPKVMAALGFDRTMISTIHDEVWTPRAAYFAGDLAWAREIVRSGRENPQRLTAAVPEYRLLRQERCILVSDPRNNEAMYKALVRPSLNRPGSDGGSQSMEDESHGSTEEVPRRVA